MWCLLALAAAHLSPHGFLSGSNAPAQAVYEYYTDSLSLAVVELANDNNISIKAHNTHPEVNSKLFDYIDTNYMTSPLWLTSNPHTPQAKLVLAQHGAKRMLPTMMISSYWKNSTGAATGGRHPVEGDSASATLAATTEPTPSSSRGLVPYFKSDVSTCSAFGPAPPSTSRGAPHGPNPPSSPRRPREPAPDPAPAAPKPAGNSKPKPKPKKPGNQKSVLPPGRPSEPGPEREHIPYNYIGKDGVIDDIYNQCELYAAFMANERMANDFDNRNGKRRKRKDKKKRKVHPLRSYFRKQNSLQRGDQRGINDTVRSARARMFNLGLTHDQVAAAKERAEKSVWNLSLIHI